MTITRRRALKGAAGFGALAAGEVACGRTPVAALPVATWSPGGDPSYPTYGDRSYQVTHYRIGVSYSTASRALWGSTTIRGKVVVSTTSLALDFALPVNKVLVNGRRAKVTVESARKVVLSNVGQLLAGQSLRIEVHYLGYPAAVWNDMAKRLVIGKNGVVLTPSNGIAFVGEPTCAPYWYPSNDRLADKATYDVSISTQSMNTIIASGLKVSASAMSNGWRNERWRLTQPSSTYHPLMAVGRYEARAGTVTVGGRSVPNLLYVARSGTPSARANAWAGLGVNASVLEYFAARFGRYPFDSAGGVVLDGAFAAQAQEAATRPVYRMADASISAARIKGLVAHEQAHMWFGNATTAAKWSEVAFLQEGLATLAQWDYQAAYLGAPSANSRMRSVWTGTSTDWSRRLGGPGAGREFATATYRRGPAAMQAIRNRVGAKTWNDVLRVWVARHRYGNATIAQFKALCEGMGKADLTALFNAWVWTPAKPAQTLANGWK